MVFRDASSKHASDLYGPMGPTDCLAPRIDRSYHLSPLAAPAQPVGELSRPADLLESVRRLHAGLQSFLSMRRIEARRKNASAFRLRFSQSLASLRQRLSHAMVRSTIQRLGNTTNPLTRSERFDD